jgi:hypothetical protein
VSSYYFIKLYNEILENPKMGQLPNSLWRRYFELALIANQQPGQDGSLPVFGDIAWILRISEVELSLELNDLKRRGLVDYKNNIWYIINFAGRFKTEVSHYNTPEWRATRAEILERDAHTCQYCEQYATHVDHVVPRIQGGGDEPENLVAACESCNKGKGGRTPEEANMELRE